MNIDSSMLVLGVNCWSPPIKGFALSRFGELSEESKLNADIKRGSFKMFGGASMCNGDWNERHREISKRISKGEIQVTSRKVVA